MLEMLTMLSRNLDDTASWTSDPVYRGPLHSTEGLSCVLNVLYLLFALARRMMSITLSCPEEERTLKLEDDQRLAHQLRTDCQLHSKNS